jgi:RNA polymerase sigma-70 factor (ECF subfamily)
MRQLDRALDAARSGDERALETLFRMTCAGVVGYLRARDVGDPDGLANEVFLRAFRTLHSFTGDGEQFRSWLFVIAHHAAIDDARRRRCRPIEKPVEHALDVPCGDVESEVIARLAQDRVEALLVCLSADQREVVTLRVLADLSIAQTAAVMGKSHEAVKALQHRALAALRRALSDPGVPK